MTARKECRCLAALVLALVGHSGALAQDQVDTPRDRAVQRPNVLFIAVDDLNDWVGHLQGHPNAKTPHIDQLAKNGVSFTRAYSAAPLCNPSRISLLTGVLPSRSGVYGNGEKLRDKMPEATTLPQYFRRHGYRTQGAGKIFHGANSPGDAASWDYYFVTPKRSGAAPARRPKDIPASAWVIRGLGHTEFHQTESMEISDLCVGESVRDAAGRRS